MIPRGTDIPNIFEANLTNSKLFDNLMNMYNTLKDRIDLYPSSTKYHHWWIGGWSDHTAQVMQISFDLFLKSSSYADIKDFDINDVILVSFVHDLDKLWRYVQIKEPKDNQLFEYRKDIIPYAENSKVVAECYRNGIQLTDQHIEAIDHHHGGYSLDMSSVFSKNTHMTKLSVIIHCADMLSYYLWGNAQRDQDEVKSNG